MDGKRRNEKIHSLYLRFRAKTEPRKITVTSSALKFKC